VRRTAALGLALAVSCAASGVVAAWSFDRAANVSEPAVRSGEQIQVLPRPEHPKPCERVIVIGDSLMDNSEPWLIAELDDAGFTAFVDAQPSRQIPAAIRVPFSGVTAARSIRSSWGEADCWMIALGSNDLIFGGGQTVASATVRIDEMLSAVTPGAAVWWVNVDYHPDPRTGRDMVAATKRFNEALDRKATSTAALTVIDWYTLAEANLQWFFDPVHVDRTGSIVRAEFTVAALPRRR
jgi:hypothetical protein